MSFDGYIRFGNDKPKKRQFLIYFQSKKAFGKATFEGAKLFKAREIMINLHKWSLNTKLKHKKYQNSNTKTGNTSRSATWYFETLQSFSEVLKILVKNKVKKSKIF